MIKKIQNESLFAIPDKKKKTWLSHSGIEGMNRCKRCFYLQYNNKIYHPEGIQSRLANRFDVVFKFDYTKNPINPDISIITQELELQGDSKIIPAFKRKSFLHQSFSTLHIMWLVYGLIIVLICVVIFFLYKKYKYKYRY